MNKKTISIGLIFFALFAVGFAFAVDQCVLYSSNPSALFSSTKGRLGGLRVHSSSSGSGSKQTITIDVSSSIKEPVKITAVKFGSTDYVWKVKGDKRLSAQGDTTLTLSNEIVAGELLIEAETCD